jgi:hypothetical protein
MGLKKINICITLILFIVIISISCNFVNNDLSGRYEAKHGHGIEFLILNKNGSYEHGIVINNIKKAKRGLWYYEKNFFDSDVVVLDNWCYFVKNGDFVEDFSNSIFSAFYYNETIIIDVDVDNYNFKKVSNKIY